MSSKPYRLDLEQVTVSTFETQEPLSATAAFLPMGGVSDWPMICSCFGTCDWFCNGGFGGLVQ